MENPIIKNGYEEAKQKAKEFYAKVGSVRCPALDDDIVFNSSGFHHLLRKWGKRRLPKEQHRRFALLEKAPHILGDPNATFIHTEQIIMQPVKWQGEKKMVASRADFWKFKAKEDGRTVTVIVRKLEKGKKHFFSIY